ncbi:MAG: class I mannose-6-phosphate isomerase [Clostridia bacterium]|nr:class I mannose-6-phosphate isomerase [Clostridia bacterium]
MKHSTDNAPFLLSPVGKDYLWGGTRLNDEYAKNLPMTPLAETWECSTHPDGVSVVASGVYSGMPLDLVLKENPGLKGDKYRDTDGLPILVKLIDAARDLSVQVHPDDDYAGLHEGGSAGKTEAWFVVEAQPDASLVLGFSEPLSKEEIASAVSDGSVTRLLRRVPVKAGDAVLIEPGTVHAIGGGILLAEIQQSSNVTYRLYDWGRTGADGKPRELHLAKALDVINPSSAPEVFGAEEGVRCPKFSVDEIKLTEGGEPFGIAGKDSFAVILLTEGEAILSYEGGAFYFWKGDCVFVPAGVSVRLRGNGRALYILP